jgi:hypothetical protein
VRVLHLSHHMGGRETRVCARSRFQKPRVDAGPKHQGNAPAGLSSLELCTGTRLDDTRPVSRARERARLERSLPGSLDVTVTMDTFSN